MINPAPNCTDLKRTFIQMIPRRTGLVACIVAFAIAAR